MRAENGIGTVHICEFYYSVHSKSDNYCTYGQRGAGGGGGSARHSGKASVVKLSCEMFKNWPPITQILYSRSGGRGGGAQSTPVRGSVSSIGSLQP